MDLSVKVLDGLQILGDSNLIPDTLYDKSINLFYKSLLTDSCANCINEDAELSKLKQGALKQAQAAFLTFILEATKCDTDTSTMVHVLEDCKIPSDRIDLITKVHEKHKSEVQILLSSSTHGPPHIVDVHWTLQHSLKNNSIEKVNQPEYLIKLDTEEIGQAAAAPVQFSCTQEQLQDLVGKLKDACKSLEKTAQQQ